MNTRDRRASAFGRSLPFLAVFPLPDGAVSTLDRRQAAWLYRALLFPSGVTTPGDRIAVVQAQPRTFEVT